jgi:hypothetical protein
MSDIEEALKRITAHQGVMGVAVFDDTGKLARYSLPQVRNKKQSISDLAFIVKQYCSFDCFG